MNTGNNIDGATNDISDSINPANANANANDETDALHLEALALGDHSGSITSALRGSLHAIKSDEPGRYGRDGYLSGVDDTTMYMLCNMIISYCGIVRSDDDIRTAVEAWCTNRTNAIERYGHISYWDTSAVTNMAELFKNKRDFDDDISKWDVSNVTNMYRMFDHAQSFNQPIDAWDTHNVTTMMRMFEGATSFNQPIGAWDTHNVTDMYGMFYDGCPLKQSPPHWYH